MSEIQPKTVVILGTNNLNPPTPQAILLDAKGVVQVSPPQQIQGGVEVVADILGSSAGTIAAGKHGLLVVSVGYGTDVATGNIEQISTGPNNADAVAAVAAGNQNNNAFLFAWDGAAWDRVRIASVFKTAFLTAIGPTAIWTPAAGKKIRLMGYTIDVGGTAAATGPQRIELLDNATIIRNHIAQVIQTQTANISGGDSHMGADLGQGILFAAINEALNVTLSVAMATGGVAINVWGTEE